MKLWVDDVRPAPNNEEYFHVVSVEQAIDIIKLSEHQDEDFAKVSLIDIDHDAGEYAKYGGDYIKLLDWLEETHRNYPIHIHSMNPVGIENMRRIIRRNGWSEV